MTDLEKLKKLFDELNIKYFEDKYPTFIKISVGMIITFGFELNGSFTDFSEFARR